MGVICIQKVCHNRRFAKEFHLFTIIDKILTGDSAGDESEVEQVTAFLGRALALIKAAEKIHFRRPRFHKTDRCDF